MPNLTQLRLAGREIFDEALRAVDPRNAVRSSIAFDGSSLRILDTTIELGSRKIISIAIGKAALPMALELEDLAGGRFSAGLIVGPIAGQPFGRETSFPPGQLSTRWQWVEGGHPLPNKASLIAASEAFALLDRANREHALVIFLISGGGSAMMEWPIDQDISLADLRVATKALINCGASISEINSVRRAFSAIKGGRLGARARDCEKITLIVSDVPRGEEANVASGPTIAPPADAPRAPEVTTRFNLGSQLPASIIQAIERKAGPADHSLLPDQYQVLLDNGDALKAAAQAAQQRGLVTEVSADISDQSIDEGCTLLLQRLEATRERFRDGDKLLCLISGGEFACPVTGDGIGGRNLETALRLARSSKLGPNTVALCAGTDGIDGNSPAAGAIVDSTTIQRAKRIGLDAEDFLLRSDSYSFFVALGDAVTTGPTGTNVRDIRILITNNCD